jgi:hypothetical protein
MNDPNLPLLKDAVHKLAPFLDEIVFVGGVTLGLLITDKAAAPIRGTTDVDVIAEIITYADYIMFSEHLRNAHFTEDSGETAALAGGTTARSSWMCFHSAKRCSVLPISGMSRRSDTHPKSYCPEGDRSVSSMRRFSWQPRWKRLGVAARWTFKPAMISKIS